jgi:hypothetical protein
MRKRSYTKVAAIVSIVAILSLTAPGLFASDSFRNFFRFERLLDRPAVFLYSFFYFTPVYNIDKVLASPTLENENGKSNRILGVIDSVRPANED